MEASRNHEIEPMNRIKALAGMVFNHISQEPAPHMSNHYRKAIIDDEPNLGGYAEADVEHMIRFTLHVEEDAAGQLFVDWFKEQKPRNRWDDMGCYTPLE